MFVQKDTKQIIDQSNEKNIDFSISNSTFDLIVDLTIVQSSDSNFIKIFFSDSVTIGTFVDITLSISYVNLTTVQISNSAIIGIFIVDITFSISYVNLILCVSVIM